MRPSSFFGDWSSQKIAPKPPDAAADVRLSVSPVSSKKNSVNFDPGRNTPFSGRLNGVAPAAFASVFASGPGSGVDESVVAIVTHFVGYDVPYWCSARYPGALMSPSAVGPNTSG